MTIYTITRPAGPLVGAITLAGSKSISNRVQIIRALSAETFPIERLANAKDTVLLEALLNSPDPIRDAGAAGTTFRFMTAFLALQSGEQILTGTERMKQRPIKVLVDALRELGAQITYLEQEGYPPLRIGPPLAAQVKSLLRVAANTSSQYISALLLIAPTLPAGLTLQLEGEVVSRPYIEMTLGLMAYFGVTHRWEGDSIHVAPQPYQGRPFVVEADWSAASYYYAMVALADSADLTLHGLFANSLQGDAVLPELFRPFGVQTEFLATGIRLIKNGAALPANFDCDFLRCPDLAQTLAVVAAATGVSSSFGGLGTLRIKETDRIAALERELAKVGVRVSPHGAAALSIDGQVQVPQPAPVFATYEDHRMAMAFAPLALLGPIQIAEPEVVDKSYPDFWRDLQTLGFVVSPG